MPASLSLCTLVVVLVATLARVTTGTRLDSWSSSSGSSTRSCRISPSLFLARAISRALTS